MPKWWHKMLAQMVRRVRVNAGPIVQTGTAALTGTVTSSLTDADIVTGGKTIILTLTNDTFVASGATFDAQRQAIINGVTSAQSETNGWNNVVKAGLAVTAVVRTSDTVVTITLSAFPTYSISANETITATLPASALTLGAPIVASPTFGVSFTDAWVEFENEPFDTITPVGWTSAAGQGTRALVDDGVEMNFPPGMQGGTGPWTYEKGFSRTRGLRSVHTFLVSSDYVANTVQNKVLHYWGGVDPASSNNGIQCLQVTGSGTDPLYPCFATQGTTISSPNVLVGSTKSSDPGTGGYTWINTGTAFTRGTFHTIDTRMMGNTAGNADGWVQVYMDGVLVIYVTNLAWKAGAYTFHLMKWNPTYGGLAAVPSPGNFKERTGDGAGNGIVLYSRAA